MPIPGGPFHLARIIALAMDPERGVDRAAESLSNFLPAEIGDVQQTAAMNGQFRATYVDHDLPGHDKRRSFIVSVREAR